MSLNRREFLKLAGEGIAAGLLASSPWALAVSESKVKAIAFDAFTVFDPHSVSALAEKLFPGKGVDLSNAWRTRQFEYTWLRTICHRYADFWKVTDDALVFAAKLLKLELSPDKRHQLMNAYLELKPYPDVLPALKSLRSAGMRLAFLSNMTSAMLASATKSSGLEGIFEHALSTDAVKAYKPDPRAYQMGIDAFGLKVNEIAFCAFGGWDAVGAKSFGYPTYWADRLSLPTEELDILPDAIGANLADLENFVKS
jgi:2-haloacid dehalogenase